MRVIQGCPGSSASRPSPCTPSSIAKRCAFPAGRRGVHFGGQTAAESSVDTGCHPRRRPAQRRRRHAPRLRLLQSYRERRLRGRSPISALRSSVHLTSDRGDGRQGVEPQGGARGGAPIECQGPPSSQHRPTRSAPSVRSTAGRSPSRLHSAAEAASMKVVQSAADVDGTMASARARRRTSSAKSPCTWSATSPGAAPRRGADRRRPAGQHRVGLDA